MARQWRVLRTVRLDKERMARVCVYFTTLVQDLRISVSVCICVCIRLDICLLFAFVFICAHTRTQTHHNDAHAYVCIDDRRCL